MTTYDDCGCIRRKIGGLSMRWTGRKRGTRVDREDAPARVVSRRRGKPVGFKEVLIAGPTSLCRETHIFSARRYTISSDPCTSTDSRPGSRQSNGKGSLPLTLPQPSPPHPPSN